MLSAFANTSGAWWSSASTPEATVTKVDGAVGKALVENVEAFRNQLWAQRLQATTDAIVGLRVEAVMEQNGEGYVVCYVPEGQFKPYRAEFADFEVLYAKRRFEHGHSSCRFTAMFFPQSTPKFSSQLWYRRNYDHKYQYGITLTNVGTATAEDLYMTVFISHKMRCS